MPYRQGAATEAAPSVESVPPRFGSALMAKWSREWDRDPFDVILHGLFLLGGLALMVVITGLATGVIREEPPTVYCLPAPPAK